ncbi:MAG: hypothetical protein ACRDH9_03240 [Actinomycetota bacterium]
MKLRGSPRSRRRSMLAAAAIACAALIMLPAAPASAHEHRIVGSVEVVVGWGSEPTYAGYLNAAEISVHEVGPSEEGEGPPVSDVELMVEVFFGDEDSDVSTGPLPMEEAFSEPGLFGADLIPTRPGTYTYRFTGTVAGEPFDEVFTSGPDTFSDANVPGEIQFPEQDPTNGELAESIERLGSRDDDSGGGGDLALWIALGSGVVALVALFAATRKRTSA